MEALLTNSINMKLNEFNLPLLDELDKNIQEYLEKIETVIQQFETERDTNIRNYKQKKISIVSVAKEAEIARQTIYNHREILEKYILRSQAIQEESDVFVKTELLYNKIRELEDDINLLIDRDITIEQLKHENKELTDEITSQNKAIEALEKHNKQLLDRIAKLEKTTASNNVISLQPKKR